MCSKILRWQIQEDRGIIPQQFPSRGTPCPHQADAGGRAAAGQAGKSCAVLSSYFKCCSMTFSKSGQLLYCHFLDHKKQTNNPTKSKIHHEETNPGLLQCFLPDPSLDALAHGDGMFWKCRAVDQCRVSLFIPVLQILTPVCSHTCRSGQLPCTACDHLLLLHIPVQGISRMTFRKETVTFHSANC